MNSKQFLQIGGVVLVVVGLLGMVGVIGPTPERSIFGETWWFDTPENWAHLVLGVVGLVVAYTGGASLQRSVAGLVGVLALFFGLYNLFATTFMGATLQRPLDTILHLAIAVWAYFAMRGDKAA